jgi:hypothetical protein
LLFTPQPPPSTSTGQAQGGLIRSLINFLLSNKLIVIKLRYLSPRWGDASQSEAGGIHIYTGFNSLGGQATLIAVRRGMPSNLFWKKIAIFEVTKSYLFIWLRRARGSELISKVFASRPLGSHHFRFALAPKEFTSQKKIKMFMI